MRSRISSGRSRREDFYRYQKNAVIKMNIFHTKRRQKNYMFSHKFHRKSKSSHRILQKRVNNDGIFPRVASTNGKVGLWGRRPPAGRPISINNPFFQHEVGFIQPLLSGESQLRNPWKKRPSSPLPGRFQIASVNLLSFGAFERKSVPARKVRKVHSIKSARDRKPKRESSGLAPSAA